MIWMLLDTYTDRENAMLIKSKLIAAKVEAFVETKTVKTSIGNGYTAPVKRTFLFVTRQQYEEASHLMVEWGAY